MILEQLVLRRTDTIVNADITDTYLTHIAASRLTHTNRRHELGHELSIQYRIKSLSFSSVTLTTRTVYIVLLAGLNTIY